MNSKQRTNKAFTLIELVVSIGILALVLSFAGVIFNVSIDSYRSAIAESEIMQKLRTITEQLNADFRGIAPGYGGYIAFNDDTYNIGGKTIQSHSDCIAFFADGDFQTTRQYNSKTIAGNVACIFYGPADSNSYGSVLKPEKKMLLRRQTILTDNVPSSGSDPRGEYYRESISEWRVTPPFNSQEDWVKKPIIDPNDVKDQFVMYLAQGVDNFTIQFAESDSSGNIIWSRRKKGEGQNISTNAFKFTFTLYDSNGVIKNGRTFTHIIYLDN